MKVNALKLRQSLGSVLELLQKNNEPIIIERKREPVAVLISIEMYEKRFIEYQDKQKRKTLLESFRNLAEKTEGDSLETLREIRYGKDR
ncbi:MAG: type II toxin-antitoxin system Phd/YefM family antitoxin [Bdellovibrionota bacterium]